ncbi:MAG: TonB-dependent receptor domain-containing protein [Candidatus Eremiobacter antarcticus]|nr:carboxypeptidase regulatory-like domain-containing protein [Candidatus Eremiobacteraeota bacterium]MBC5808729.1 carboxypeptidase regulatory-like domain-containing protein [Candidatus Eremiobacteraeota bacterium]
MSTHRLLRTALVALLVVVFQGTWALAGTTGSISGKVTDQNGNGIVGAKVTIASPSQSETMTTAANGFYSALNLSPDTYTITTSKDGYDSAQVYGITVQADQVSRADVALRGSTKTLGRVTTTATASVVSRTVTGDLYSVNSAAINSYAGSAGGAETLYSQNGVVGSLPGVVRNVGGGGGYASQGSLSLRGGAQDQVGYELDGVPLNRGFDFYNGTAFVTNGLASLEVYTGGAPSSEGRAMSGFINETIQRGKYPGGGDITGVIGSPTFNHTVQADVYGGTPDNRFTYYLATLASNAAYNFGDRNDLDNQIIHVAPNDPGCALFNAAATPALQPGPPLNCAVANDLTQPQSIAAYGSTPGNAGRDTVANLHWTLNHNSLNDDVQALYMVGTTDSSPFGKYASFQLDPSIYTAYSGGRIDAAGSNLWPIGTFYRGFVGQPYNPALLTTLTWPTSGNSTGRVPANFTDSQTTQYSIEKLAYTRALTQSSFLRVYAFSMYSGWTLDQPLNGIIGSSFYQLHDTLRGYTGIYQNQLNQQHLLKLTGDYSRDRTLRSNYFNYTGAAPTCIGHVDPADPTNTTDTNCDVPGLAVTHVGAPSNNWSTVEPVNTDFVISDTFKPSEKLLFDLGLRFDQFKYKLMPMTITGANGLAIQSEQQYGDCLHGFNYSPSDPRNIGDGTQNCFDILSDPTLTPNAQDRPGAAAWTDAPAELTFNTTSPRFGVTFSASPTDVLRFSVGRYVQPPNSAFEQYRDNPAYGPGRTIRRLNQFYDGLGFLVVHNVQPEDSTNYDLSYEHDFRSGLSMKITPYFRNTRGQVLNLPVNPTTPSFVTGFNFGAARIKGTEFLLRQNRASENGLSGTLAVTYTDSKIRFTKGPSGASFIDVVNTQISAYNADHGTNYALLDPAGYYSPSFTQAPTATSPSYDVRWVANLNLNYRTNGFDISPTFNYQSGNPYGDPLQFPDITADVANGPDPYTNRFDAPGSLKGPSWWTMNLGVSHDIGKNMKATVLATNLITRVHNHGYPWEQPTSQNIVAYSDNFFYTAAPLGSFGAVPPATPTAYYGDNYYPYTAGTAMPTRDFVFSISTKI